MFIIHRFHIKTNILIQRHFYESLSCHSTISNFNTAHFRILIKNNLRLIYVTEHFEFQQGTFHLCNPADVSQTNLTFLWDQLTHEKYFHLLWLAIRNNWFSLKENSYFHRNSDFSSKMLFNTLIRPVGRSLCQIPARNTSGVAGARGRHVSAVVSWTALFHHLFFIENEH